MPDPRPGFARPKTCPYSGHLGRLLSRRTLLGSGPLLGIPTVAAALGGWRAGPWPGPEAPGLTWVGGNWHDATGVQVRSVSVNRYFRRWGLGAPPRIERSRLDTDVKTRSDRPRPGEATNSDLASQQAPGRKKGPVVGGRPAPTPVLGRGSGGGGRARTGTDASRPSSSWHAHQSPRLHSKVRQA